MFDSDRTRVLVVDDEPIVANTLSLILNQKGFEATAAYSGEMALAVAALLKPNVLIIDVMMENMNGIETAFRVRESMPDCRVILVSGQAVSSDMLHRAESDGLTFEFLARPVHPTVFLDRLSAHESVG